MLRSQRLPGVYVLPAAKSPLSEYLLIKGPRLKQEKIPSLVNDITLLSFIHKHRTLLNEQRLDNYYYF